MIPVKKHELYHTWTTMKRRCSEKSRKDYYRYGGRGISVCKRWMDFHKFVEDMGKRPKGYTLDRIKPEGDYKPSNCRWASRLDQSRNRKIKPKSKYPYVTYRKKQKVWAYQCFIEGKRVMKSGFKTDKRAYDAYLKIKDPTPQADQDKPAQQDSEKE